MDVAMSGLYRRILSSPPAIDFASSQGKQLFLEANQNGTMEGFYRLVSNFQTQSELNYCGLASLSMVLNTLAIDPGRKWKGPWRWFDESMLDYYEPLGKVKARGISFRKLVCLAHCAGAKVEAFHASHSSIDDFRKYVMKCSTSDECHVISSYHRAALKQTGSGHFSPIGGYHVGKDMVLILDVARFKYPPHWVPLTLLWEGMSYIVESNGQSRGYMLISRPPREHVVLYTPEEVLKQLQETGLFKHVASLMSPSCGGHSQTPSSTDVLTMLLLSSPSTTWDDVKNEQLLREIDALISIENLLSLLQEEVSHLRHQLHLLKRCQQGKVDEDLGAPLS